jgi:deazaflavin-dependent oxidoreductase (nitroreductase family)
MMMPSDRRLRTMNLVHRALLKASFGTYGWTAAKMPVLELTTTGRRSGQPRSVMLTTPYGEGDVRVVVASRGGDDRHPDWFLNLRENPAVTVTTRDSKKRPTTARIATDEERERIWPRITEDFTNYAGYQARTDRVIPLVFLEPAD